jgi:hypothetical protein
VDTEREQQHVTGGQTGGQEAPELVLVPTSIIEVS